jgi:hypothetical protein
MSNPTGGPKTEAGKEVARWNATRHGIRSPAPVIPGLEKAEDWEEHRDGVLMSLSPEGHLELVLAERIALLSWRLHRVTRYETESIALSQEKVEEDLMKKSQHFGPSSSEATRPQDVRMEYEEAEKIQRLLKKVSTLPADRRLSTEEAGPCTLDYLAPSERKVRARGARDPWYPRRPGPGIAVRVRRFLDRLSGKGGHLRLRPVR